MKFGLFVYAKQKNVTEAQMEQGAGDVWTWTAIDADTKLIVSYMLGHRGLSVAKAFMRDVASRIANCTTTNQGTSKPRKLRNQRTSKPANPA
jgi:transposase-like protein